MLVRASNPRSQAQGLQYLYSQLNLPWLCPSLHAAKARARRTATLSREQSASPSLKSTTIHSRQALPAPHQARRGLASAAVADYALPQDDYVPFEAPTSFFGSPSSTFGPIRHVDPYHRTPGVFDPKESILVADSATTAPATFKNFNAISGEIAEIHQTLHACLQVGRLSRAVALMRRLSTLYKADAPGLLAAHNDYIRELTYRLSRSTDRQLLKDIQNWFEVSLRGKGVIPDATTYALMIQAAFQEPNAKKVKRTIKRYAHLAEEAGMLDETVAIASTTLDDASLDVLKEVRTTGNPCIL